MALLVQDGIEKLRTHGVKDAITLSSLLETSREMDKKWKNHLVINENGHNFELTDDMKLIVSPFKGSERTLDITDNGFSQLCTRMGVPAKYIKKCFAAGKTDLAISNFRAWEKENTGNMLIRESEGVARAVLSDSYEPFDNSRVLRALNYTMDKRFVPTQVYMSQDKLHIRFVDFTPLPISDGTNSPLYAGVVLSANNVGGGSLSLKYFIYRFACQNGLTISSMGGTLFRQHHIGEKMTDSKISLFNRAFMDVERLSETAVSLVKETNSKRLKDFEMQMYIEKARRDMRLSKKSVEKLEDLVGGSREYAPTTWGFVNGVTELAQDFSLDTRVEMEAWAGELFTRAAV